MTLPAGTYTLTLAAAGEEDAAATGDLDITGDLTIIGAGAAATIIDGIGGVTGDRVIHVLPGATATLAGVTVRNGNARGGAAGSGGSAGGASATRGR